MTREIDLYAAAEREIELRAEAWRGAIAAARDDIARFQVFCEVLREHGLEFDASVYPGEAEIRYWIHLARATRQAGEMMLTLAALECEELPDPGFGLEHSTILAITGPHAPEFYLSIPRTPAPATLPLAEDCHAD